MLGDAWAQRCSLANIDAHMLVESQDAVEVDGPAFMTQIPAEMLEGVEGKAGGEEMPYLGADKRVD